MGERLSVAHTVQVLGASMRNVPVQQPLSAALDEPGTALPRSVPRRA